MIESNTLKVDSDIIQWTVGDLNPHLAALLALSSLWASCSRGTLGNTQ